MSNMIHVENLRKEFKKIVKEPGLKGSVQSLFHPKHEQVIAVADVSFDVPKGEILGFIGPNGAGKSTVIKMLTGILTPTQGHCLINGMNPSKNRQQYVKNIGVVFGQRTQLWWDLPLQETYHVLKEMYEVPENRFQKKMALLREVLELDEFIKSPVRTLSLGQRMRADIAASLLHSPDVLFLDEPTIGLDVVVKENIRQAIHQINQEEGTTIILTTHDIDDIEELSDRIVLIDKGMKMYDGEIKQLKEIYGNQKEIQFSSPNAEGIIRTFSTDKTFQLEMEGSLVKVSFDRENCSTANVMKKIFELNLPLTDISIKETNMEDIIKRLYREGGFHEK